MLKAKVIANTNEITRDEWLSCARQVLVVQTQASFWVRTRIKASIHYGLTSVDLPPTTKQVTQPSGAIA